MDADKHIVRTRRLTKLGRRDAEYLGEIKSLPQGGRASCAGGCVAHPGGGLLGVKPHDEPIREPAAGNDA